MDPLQTLFESPNLRTRKLPAELARLYDGDLGFDAPRLFANFVSSIDGIVALRSVEASPSVISGKNEADRFVMGLLRAHADVVVIGAGTLRSEPEHRWTPDFIYPPASDAYAALRRELHLSSQPELWVVTAGGVLDPGIPALEGATIVTTSKGASHLRRERLASTIVDVGGGGTVEIASAIDAVRDRGHSSILSEGGPTIIGQLLLEGLLDELFLTVSPRLLGRPLAEDRPGLVQGVDLLDGGPTRGDLMSVRKHGSHLFLRYALARARSARESRAA